MHRLTLAAAAALVLTAGACATPPAEKSAAGGRAESHAKDPGAKDEKTNPGSRPGPAPGSKSGAKGKKPSWWQRLSKYHREPKDKPWVYGDIRPGKGLVGGEDGIVLHRQGEGDSSDPNKPTKVKR